MTYPYPLQTVLVNISAINATVILTFKGEIVPIVALITPNANQWNMILNIGMTSTEVNSRHNKYKISQMTTI